MNFTITRLSRIAGIKNPVKRADKFTRLSEKDKLKFVEKYPKQSREMFKDKNNILERVSKIQDLFVRYETFKDLNPFQQLGFIYLYPVSTQEMADIHNELEPDLK